MLAPRLLTTLWAFTACYLFNFYVETVLNRSGAKEVYRQSRDERRNFKIKISIPFSITSLFWKIKVNLRIHNAICVSVYLHHYLLLNSWTSLYETWYIYHGIWVQINVVLHNSVLLICVCVRVSPIVARQRLGKSVTMTTNTHVTICVGRLFFYAVRIVSKERRRFVLPRISCLEYSKILLSEDLGYDHKIISVLVILKLRRIKSIL
jgi:hypothetical protein